MKQKRLFIEQELVNNDSLMLTKEQHHYLSRVLRVKDGSKIELFNASSSAQGLVNFSNNNCKIVIDEVKPVLIGNSLQVTIAQCLSKGKRMDYTIQKATELECFEILLIQSEYCQVNAKSITSTKLNHWQQIAIHACEQSKSYHVPKINNIMSFQELIFTRLNYDVRILLEPTADLSFNDWATSQVEQPKSILLIVGPEGGISAHEQETAVNNNFIKIRLGGKMLRTETVAPVILALLHAKWSW